MTFSGRMTVVETAASELERHKDMQGLPSGIPFERMSSEVWDTLEKEYPGGWPEWFKSLTIEQRFCGAHFFLSVDPYEPLGDGVCIFWRPSEWLEEAITYPESFKKLFEIGFVPFANGEDGNRWVFRADGGDDPQVFFVAVGLWLQGDVLDADNGLLPANKSMSEFLGYGVTWKD